MNNETTVYLEPRGMVCQIFWDQGSHPGLSRESHWPCIHWLVEGFPRVLAKLTEDRILEKAVFRQT